MTPANMTVMIDGTDIGGLTQASSVSRRRPVRVSGMGNPWRLPAGSAESPAATRWTGWYTFPITWRPGLTVTLEVNARRDDVSIWLANSTLAVIDRDRFRDWLCDPSGPLREGDLELSVADGVILLNIGGCGPYTVPQDAARFLTVTI